MIVTINYLSIDLTLLFEQPRSVIFVPLSRFTVSFSNARTLLLLLLARIFANLWRTLSPTSEAWKMRVLLVDSPCQFVSPLFNMPPRDLGLLTNAFYVFLYAPFLRVSRFSGSEKRPICWHWSRNVAEPESRALFASFVFIVLPRPS